MGNLKVSTMAQQVADHLRDELERGRWTGLMPGRDRLAVELGVNRKTVEAALVKLEGEGVLEAQGRGGGGGFRSPAPRSGAFWRSWPRTGFP